MSSIYEINQDVVYVKGICRGALYNFTDGNVYSINQEACLLLDKVVCNETAESEYLALLYDKNLLNKNFAVREFSISRHIPQELVFVWLEITESCNLKCLHCYEGDDHKKSKSPLTLEQWKNVLVQLKELNCKRVEFIGGEPCMSDFFIDLLQYAVSIGHIVDIYSNLTLFNAALVDFIEQHSIRVHFTLYGDNADTHDSITQSHGSFHKTLYWLKEMASKNITLIPSAIGMKKNQENIGKVKRFLSALGIPKYRGYDIVRETSKRGISELYPTNGIEISVLRWKPSFYANKEYFLKAASVNTCWYGKFSITDDGNVLPCEFSRDVIYGNLKDQSIQQILQSKTLQDFWYFDFSKINDCKHCEYRFACKDCRPLSKNIYEKNPRCLYNPNEGTWHNPPKMTGSTNSKE